jgi:hypothetical protein
LMSSKSMVVVLPKGSQPLLRAVQLHPHVSRGDAKDFCHLFVPTSRGRRDECLLSGGRTANTLVQPPNIILQPGIGFARINSRGSSFLRQLTLHEAIPTTRPRK